MNKKWLTALALSGFLLAGGSAFAMEPTINVDSSTANMPNKAESHLLKVNVVTPEIKQISGVVYEQVPSRGYENVAMKMDILKPQSKTPLPAIVYGTGGGFINANKDTASSSACTWLKPATSSHPSNTASLRRLYSRSLWKT